MLETLDLLLAAIVISAVVLHFLGRKLPLLWRFVGLFSILCISLLPYPYGLSTWLLSYISGFSITTGILALLAIESVLWGRYTVKQEQMQIFYILLSITALVFYPSSMGAIGFDAYSYGYGNFTLSSILLAIGMIAWFKRFYLLCLILATAQIAFAAELLISDNLWDYLLDPCLVIFAMCRVVKGSFCKEKTIPAQAI